MTTKQFFQNEMKAITAFLFAAIISLSFSACSENDNPAPNPLVEGITGMWYAEVDATGTIGEGDDAQEYYKAVQVADFSSETEGFWAKYYINKAEEVITLPGGYHVGNFTYKINPDNTINIDITHDNDKVDETDHMSMKYVAGQIVGKDGSKIYKLAPATAEQKVLIDQYGRQIGMGYDDTDPLYNINNDTVLGIVNKSFDKTNWWEHSNIIIRVSNTDATNNIKDKYNRTGYLSVVLPWAKDSGGGTATSESQLPDGFCDGLTPENGWSLVANFCGRYSFINANYIALYNKYTGILRYFYYIPNDTKLNDAVDHNWEILMQKGTAEHAVFGYALPNDRTPNLKDFEAIKARNAGYYSQFTTPYCTTGDMFGQLQPQKGWYAFDIDLSVYRGEGTDGKTSMMDDQVIKPIIRGYKKSNIELFGKVTADITGSINMEKCAVNSSSGVFGPFEDMLGEVKGIKDFIDDATKVYTDMMSGNVMGAIEGGISVAKRGCDMAGIDYGAGKEGFDGYKGTANMKLDGVIDLSGAIKESNVIQGPSSITQSLGEFDFSDTHLGEGVWNLAETPVVYYTNAQMQWRFEYTQRDVLSDVEWTDFSSSPFGGKKEEWRQESTNSRWANTSSKPWCGYINYFDPTSVKVVLNPKLFTKDEIDNAQVYATCGVRKAMSAFGSVDSYRKAFGLNKSKQDINMDGGRRIVNRAYSEAPYNALSSSKDKHGMKTNTTFAATKYDDHNCGMFGCGDGDYILEPQPLSGDDHPLCTYMPSYEVTVTVIINHGGKNYVYTRSYLPEYKSMRVADMPAPTPTKDYGVIRPTHYVPAVFAQQMDHYRDVYNWTRRALQPYQGQAIAYIEEGIIDDIEYEDHDYAYQNVFDGYYSSKWRSIREARDDVGLIDKKVWWASCQTYTGVSPTGYILTTADNRHNKSYNPRIWYVFGSRDGENWVLLDSRSTAAAGGIPTADALPNSSMTGKKYTFNKAKADNYKYYRIDISQSWHEDDETYMQFSEFELTYD